MSEPVPRLKFTVFRDTWLRGGESCLLDESGNRCCLGHAARDFGIDDMVLEDQAMPRDARSRLWPDSLLEQGKDSLAWQAAGINDATRLTDAQREARLVSLFASYSIDVEFKDSAEA